MNALIAWTLAVPFLVSAACAQQTPESKPAEEQPLIPLTKPTKQEVVLAREDAIEAELNSRSTVTPHKEPAWAADWAGRYYVGDGLGMNVFISIAPQNGVSYTWHGCMGLYDCNMGDIVETFPDGVRVKLAYHHGDSSYDFMSERLYFVSWGMEKFLVPEAKMMDLVNHYNEGGYARSSLYSAPRRWSADGPRRMTTEPTGRPALPEKWARLIVEEPLKLTVIRIEQMARPKHAVLGEGWTATLHLAVSPTSKVFKGMSFPYALHPFNTLGTITVEEVGDNACTAKAELWPLGRASMTPPLVGTEFAFPGATRDRKLDRSPRTLPSDAKTGVGQQP